MNEITVKKLTIVNQQHEQVKESTVFLSSRLSQFGRLLDTFEITSHNPIRLEYDEAVAIYKRLTEQLGKIGVAIKKVESEILIDNEN